MDNLSADEQNMLVDLINEQLGAHLSFDEFADAVLGLFEDVPGFETVAPAKADRYIRQLWSQYHGQNSR